MKNLPEMVFGKNKLKMEHEGGFSLEFNTFDALKLVDNSSPMPKVAYSQHWIQSKAETLDSGEM